MLCSQDKPNKRPPGSTPFYLGPFHPPWAKKPKLRFQVVGGCSFVVFVVLREPARSLSIKTVFRTGEPEFHPLESVRIGWR